MLRPKCPFALLLLAVSCGGQTLSAQGAPDASASGGSSGAGGTSAGAGGETGATREAGTDGAPGDARTDGDALGHDECHSDADCLPTDCFTAPCYEHLCAMGNDGYHHCTSRIHPPVASCQNIPISSCCQADSDCTGAAHGHCIPFTYEYCGGPPPAPGNGCRYDQCVADGDCKQKPNGFCTANYPRSCVYGPCHTNADCNAKAGGRCVMAVVREICSVTKVFCQYAGDPCLVDSDCMDGGSFLVCVPNSDLQGTVCRIPPPPPP